MWYADTRVSHDKANAEPDVHWFSPSYAHERNETIKIKNFAYDQTRKLKKTTGNNLYRKYCHEQKQLHRMAEWVVITPHHSSLRSSTPIKTQHAASYWPVYASSNSSMRSPGASKSPCFSFVLPLQGRDFTFKPSSSSGTEIFISIFMDSSTTSGSPAFKTSPVLTLYERISPGTTVGNSYLLPGVAFRGPESTDALTAASGSVMVICTLCPSQRKPMVMPMFGAVPNPRNSICARLLLSVGSTNSSNCVPLGKVRG